METKVKKDAVSNKAIEAALASLAEKKKSGKPVFAEKVETVTKFLNNVKVSAL